MKLHLKGLFKDEIGLDSALDSFDKTFRDVLPYETNIRTSEYELVSNRAALSESCLIKIFLNDNILEFIIFCFFIILFIFGLVKEAQSKKQIEIAEVLYKCIFLYIRENKKVI